MKALFFNERLEYHDDLSKPQPEPGEVLVKVNLAGICRTDLELTRGYMGFMGVPGHEFVGVVEDDRYPDLNGKRVVGEINCPCGNCSLCARGLGNHCPSRTVLGISDRDGVFAEYTSLPKKNLHLVPSRLSDEEAVFAEPVAAAIQVTTQVPIRPGTEVVILGGGKLGLLIAQVIGRISGHTTLVDKHPSKINLIDEPNINFITLHKLKKESQKGFQVVVECTGSPAGIRLAKEIVAPRGTIVLKSTYQRGTTFNFSDIVVNEVTLIGSRCGPFPSALQMLRQGEINVLSMISETFPLHEGVSAFLKAGTKGSMKILLSIP